MKTKNRPKIIIKTTISKQQVIDRIDEIKSYLTELFEKVNREFYLEDTYEFQNEYPKRKGESSVLLFQYGIIWGLVDVDPRVIVEDANETTLFESGAISFNFDNEPLEHAYGCSYYKYFGSQFGKMINGEYRGEQVDVLWHIGNYIYNSKIHTRRSQFLQEWQEG